MDQAQEHWAIFGAGSAIARAFARELALAGASISLAGRNVEDLEILAADLEIRGATSAKAISFDALDFESHKSVARLVARPDSILNVLIAFGTMPDHEAMEAEFDLARGMIDATFTGAVSILQAVMPVIEKQKGGKIIVIASVAGDRGRLKNYLYGSAKAALATYAEGLRAKLFPSGATVTVVKPGFVDTAMTWGLPGLFLVASPEKLARKMLIAANSGKPTLYYPYFWRLILLIIQHIPANIMKRLKF